MYFFGLFMALLKVLNIWQETGGETCSKGTRAGSQTQVCCRASAHGAHALPTELNSTPLPCFFKKKKKLFCGIWISSLNAKCFLFVSLSLTTVRGAEPKKPWRITIYLPSLLIFPLHSKMGFSYCSYAWIFEFQAFGKPCICLFLDSGIFNEGKGF